VKRALVYRRMQATLGPGLRRDDVLVIASALSGLRRDDVLVIASALGPGLRRDDVLEA